MTGHNPYVGSLKCILLVEGCCYSTVFGDVKWFDYC